MKDYKVKATRSFTDGVENIVRNIDDEFECTKERYEQLLSHNAVELIGIKVNIIDVEEEIKKGNPYITVHKEEAKPVKKTTKKKNK